MRFFTVKYRDKFCDNMLFNCGPFVGPQARKIYKAMEQMKATEIEMIPVGDDVDVSIRVIQ